MNRKMITVPLIEKLVSPVFMNPEEAERRIVSSAKIPIPSDEECLNPDNRPMICISTSMSFIHLVQPLQMWLEHYGWISLAPIPVGMLLRHMSSEIPKSDIENMLMNKHKDKIRKSSVLYVVNPDSYIGESVNEEIEYAKSLHKDIYYMVDPE